MITEEQLIESGWVKKGDPYQLVFFEKDLTDTEDEDYDPESGKICMILHRFTPGYTLFGLRLPDGGIVNINPDTIEDLNKFESLIIGYDPPY